MAEYWPQDLFQIPSNIVFTTNCLTEGTNIKADNTLKTGHKSEKGCQSGYLHINLGSVYT
jgi:hypothetical protein